MEKISSISIDATKRVIGYLHLMSGKPPVPPSQIREALQRVDGDHFLAFASNNWKDEKGLHHDCIIVYHKGGKAHIKRISKKQAVTSNVLDDVHNGFEVHDEKLNIPLIPDEILSAIRESMQNNRRIKARNWLWWDGNKGQPSKWRVEQGLLINRLD